MQVVVIMMMIAAGTSNKISNVQCAERVITIRYPCGYMRVVGSVCTDPKSCRGCCVGGHFPFSDIRKMQYIPDLSHFFLLRNTFKSNGWVEDPTDADRYCAPVETRIDRLRYCNA